MKEGKPVFYYRVDSQVQPSLITRLGTHNFIVLFIFQAEYSTHAVPFYSVQPDTPTPSFVEWDSDSLKGEAEAALKLGPLLSDSARSYWTDVAASGTLCVKSSSTWMAGTLGHQSSVGGQGLQTIGKPPSGIILEN
jgi:hypothetical protein